MKNAIHQLDKSNISSEIYVVAPTQIDYIARVFAKNFADTMNMRIFAAQIYQTAEQSLRYALGAAKKMGEHH